ncbi:S41 family peptidase [Flavobacterium restrictum]|uniref:Peptidase S41 n=1 Tax=Flavobacterium restrictum TaxID=2594428 RepID=A0A553DXN0_9FLAO|nr:S41 family peptidase [Flavobacterium restrictum]TRX37517.1 peptidase S41 [Flavobacterium restrictum]
MKKFSLLLFLVPFWLFSQNNKNPCDVLFKINNLIQQEHVNPKPVDDSLSVYVFDQLINELDPLRNILFKSDYDALSHQYRLSIDDFIKSKNCAFINDITTVYATSLKRNKALLEKLNSQKIDFETPDTIRFYKKSFPIYMTENDVEKIWKKKIRFEILNEATSSSKNLDSIQANFATIALELKNKIIQNELCKINAILEKDLAIQEKIYTHFCTYFDPHTNYLSTDTKSSFVSSLSKERLSLGFVVSLNEKNEIIIADLDLKGPAYKNGKIKKGDQIISLSNQKETLEVSCTSLDAIANLIQSDANKIITLTLKRKAEKNFTVTIEKEILKDDLNSVYSFIITKKSKIGYIRIPSFYSNFEGFNSLGCAEDVAREVIKLQKDNIKGLVIDLKDNGGGSMEEAIKLAGIFVHHGPISIVVDHKKQQQVLEDPFRGFLYKGPIVILVNGNSASASEFFAGILQDYNRAMIVGSSTLGKATMQTILPLEKGDESNFVKVTINKFYRVTGKSHQSIGVIPDVALPEFYDPLLEKESNFTTAFKNDSIATDLKFKPYVSSSLIQELSKNSLKRVATDSYFNDILGINKKIEALVNTTKASISMTLQSVFEEQNNSATLWEEITKFDDKIDLLSVTNSNYNEALLMVYPLEKENNKNQIKALKTNHYLNEAVTIIEEFNALK